jgi:hypothetical protein
MKKLLVILVAILLVFTMSGCTPADQVSDNLSKEADHFNILRKIIFYNVITGEDMYVIEGYCSIYADTLDEQLEVTCEINKGEYIKDFLGVSDNVSYMVLQVDPKNVSAYHYKVYLRPQTVLPSIEWDVE